jgi:hypothetical protein
MGFVGQVGKCTEEGGTLIRLSLWRPKGFGGGLMLVWKLPGSKVLDDDDVNCLSGPGGNDNNDRG